MSPTLHDWTSSTFRTALLAMVRRRVPEREAEDVVQTVLAEAIASPHRPNAPDEARRWIWGITRNKVADWHRSTRREILDNEPALARNDNTAAPDEATNDLLRWALQELPAGVDAKRTLVWLLREADGEKLEEIAASEGIDPVQVRQRVSRMRRWFRERWGSQVAALAALSAIVFVVWVVWRHTHNTHHPERPLVHEPSDIVATRERARVLREDAFRDCNDARWTACLDAFDRARVLDPVGDEAAVVREFRQRAQGALRRDAGTPQVAPPPSPFEMFTYPDGGNARRPRRGRTEVPRPSREFNPGGSF
jgi:RNA polymerase sigma factor (sigma-70 family)